MSREYETGYQELSSIDEDNELPIHEAEVFIHESPNNNYRRWNHIEDLDDFFTRVYHYHQRHGFACMVLADILQLVQFVFIILLSTFLITCVDYPVLFGEKHLNGSRKVTIPDVIKSQSRIHNSFSSLLIICLLMAGAFWLLRFAKVMYNMMKYCEIRAFYLTALKIPSSELPNLTWHEVQRTLLDVQRDLNMCIHKSELTELDIYHRILRFKNYMVAIVNKSIIKLTFNLPFLGQWAYLSTSLKYNLEIILFWGPWSLFANSWQLRDVYKDSYKRHDLSKILSQRILWIGIANFILLPVIFFWQILYAFFRYGELIKRSPSVLGARKWTEYGRLQLRHFNELDHEFKARLNRAYKPATDYLDIFANPVIVIIAKNIAFIAGSVLAILIVLTVYDEDVLTVEHILTLMTISGVIVTICRVFIPDHNAVQCPEQLLLTVLAHIHYMPNSWRGHAHTASVRHQFAMLFSFKAVYLIEELLSPVITPFIICFYLRHESLAIIDFFRNFTIDVVGVGDVCSFAQMDVRKHGHSQWKALADDDLSPVTAEDTLAGDSYMQAEEGKTELSLMHFHMTNPEWIPSISCGAYITTLKQQAQSDAASMLSMTTRIDNPVINSLASLHNPSFAFPTGLPYMSLYSSLTSLPQQQVPKLRGAVSTLEGPPLTKSSGGLLSSIHSIPDSDVAQSLQFAACGSLSRPTIDDTNLEFLSADMSFSALYMHELRRRRVQKTDSLSEQTIWQRMDSPPTHMPGINEEGEELNTSA